MEMKEKIMKADSIDIRGVAHPYVRSGKHR